MIADLQQVNVSLREEVIILNPIIEIIGTETLGRKSQFIGIEHLRQRSDYTETSVAMKELG